MPSNNTFRVSRNRFDRSGHSAAAALKNAVANLSRGDIGRLPRPQLIAALKATGALDHRPGCRRRLQNFDRLTLMKLLYLVRRSLRRQGYGTNGFGDPHCFGSDLVYR